MAILSRPLERVGGNTCRKTQASGSRNHGARKSRKVENLREPCPLSSEALRDTGGESAIRNPWRPQTITANQHNRGNLYEIQEQYGRRSTVRGDERSIAHGARRKY